MLATSLVPSFVISSHEVSPLATETLTTVCWGAAVVDELSWVFVPSVVVVVVVVVVVGVEGDPVDVVSEESVEVVLTGTVVFVSCDVDLLFTHERTERTKMTVSTSASATMTRRIVRRLSCGTRPRERPERRPRWLSERRRTLGRSTLAMFLDERLPEMVDARS